MAGWDSIGASAVAPLRYSVERARTRRNAQPLAAIRPRRRAVRDAIEKMLTFETQGLAVVDGNGLRVGTLQHRHCLAPFDLMRVNENL